MIKMIKYAKSEDMKGNFNFLVRQIIEKTGPNLFKPIKCLFFGLRDKEFEELQLFHKIKE